MDTRPLEKALQIPNYEILDQIAEGGMATVYLAKQQNLDRKVALKVMSPTFAGDATLRDHFIREGQIIARLSHPHIITIHDIGVHEGHYYMAMEYMPGDNLKQRMQEGLNARETIRIVRQIGKALGYAHFHDFIHRDIKPGNVLFRPDGTVILTDFGVAKPKNSTSDLTRRGYFVGTPHYMSPEQAQGKEIDHRSDLYSLGVLFYEMLAGVKPFRADDTMAIAYKHVHEPIPKLPLHVSQYQKVIDKLLAKEKSERYSNAREFIDALENSDDTATRIMPTLVKRKAPANQISDTQSLTQLTRSPFTPLAEWLFNLRIRFSGLLSRVATKFSRGVPDITMVNPISPAATTEEISDILNSMQRRQRELEAELVEQKAHTQKLEQKLLDERSNRTTASDTTLVRLAELDKHVQNENEKARELEVILKGTAEEINQLNQHVETEYDAFADLEQQALKNSASDPIKAATEPEIVVSDPVDLPLEPTEELLKPDRIVIKHAKPGIHLLSPLLKDGSATIDGHACLLCAQVNSTKKISKLTINGHPAPLATNGFFCIKYHVGDGGHDQIHIVAECEGDEQHELIFQLNATSKRPKDQQKPDSTGRSYALLVGNSDYQQFPAIPSAARDAESLGELLGKKYGFTVELLTDCSAVEIVRSLANLYQQFQSGDNLLVYFTGHSVVKRSGDMGFWLGVEAVRGQPRSWLANDAVRVMVDLFNAHQSMIIADACFTESIPATESLFDRLRSLVIKPTTQMRPAESCQLVLSSGWRQPITCAEDPGESLFSGSLLSILRHSNGWVGTEELHHEITRRVARHQLNNLGIRPVYGVLRNSKSNEGEFLFRPA